MDEPTERVCTKCRECKSFDQFSRAPRGKYGRKSSCKECDAIRHARLHPPRARISRPRREPLPGDATKTCTKCKAAKTVDEFSVSRKATETTNVVYRPWCKECCSIQALAWYRANPERAIANKRRSELSKRYGLTRAQYDAMVQAQHGTCAICGSAEKDAPRGRLHVDHDHETGAVRGLLCNRCNRAMGLFQDDPHIMRRAIGYLVRARRGHLGGK